MTPDDALALARLRADVASGRVADIRRICGLLTQREVAQTVGTTPAAIGGWEAGRRMPRGQAALRYARLLEDLERQHTARTGGADAA
jgi:DNA-binding XRE family transcriptional regulator